MKAAVQIEIRQDQSSAPIRTQTSDICANGCYVEMSITLEVGERVSIVLWLGPEKLATEGKVVTRHPQFGNGIEFVGIPEAERERLSQYLGIAAMSQV